MTGPPYVVIVADCPWAFGDKLTMSTVKRGSASNYGTLSTDELKGLPVCDLAAKDAVLLLWRPDSLISVALSVMEAWGFRQTQEWAWLKTAKRESRLDSGDIPDDLHMGFGMGRLARNCDEKALVGVRGSPYKMVVSRSERNVFLSPNMGHSTKPEVVQDALDRMFPDVRRLELFARRQRSGWDCVGDEAPETRGEDIRSTLERLRCAET